MPSGTRSFAGFGGAECRRSASRRSRTGAAETRKASSSARTWTSSTGTATEQVCTSMCPSQTWPRWPSGAGRPGSTGWRGASKPSTRATRGRP
eukprot:5427259-Lingulodinium_polyedra.AAC.1